MTLVSDVLDAVQDNWDGQYPSDLTRLNRDDSADVGAGRRVKTADLETANYVTASLASDDDEPFAARADPAAEAVVGVTVQGMHASEYGNVADDDAFRTLVRGVKDALREERHDPVIGASHPATWVRVFLESSAVDSGDYYDHYFEAFDVRLRGHY